MKFLQHIASTLLERYGTDLSGHTMVFPGRRAGIYFRAYLSELSDKPVWSPELITINELFERIASREVTPPEIQVFELYRSYRKVMTNAEPFDEFYSWGEMIIQDFDDIDKYLVDSGMLYQNLLDLKDIDRKFGALDEETIKLILEFWVNFNPSGLTEEKEKFLSLWDILDRLYKEFRNSLAAGGKASEGMIYRQVAEMEPDKLLLSAGSSVLHFVGFNAINNCEKVLFDILKKGGKAHFYWDYDNHYISDTVHKAGYFLRKNIEMYGQSLSEPWDYNMIDARASTGRTINVFSASSDSSQTQVMASILRERISEGEAPDHHTAVILADENLLIPALAAIPSEISDINVTMGYPLRMTPAYGLVRNLLLIQKRLRSAGSDPSFNHREVIPVLRHSYFRRYEPESTALLIRNIVSQNLVWIRSSFFNGHKLWEKIFSAVAEPLGLLDYLEDILGELFAMWDEGSDEESIAPEASLGKEYIYHTILIIRRIRSVSEYKDIDFNHDTVIRLLDKILRNLAIPFTGEPLKGVQVMGLLETRALDFDNIVMLSVNEGTLPKASSPATLIPYNLREAFGLPTLNHQDSIFSYYFYRLLHRTKRIDLLYNDLADGISSGEMSRFILQMKYDPRMEVTFSDKSVPVSLLPGMQESIKRTPEHDKILHSIFLAEGGKAISPSALNIWLGCRMKFYNRYISGLKIPDKITPEVDAMLFGNMIHDALNIIYNPFVGKLVQEKDIRRILASSEIIESAVSSAFNSEFFKGRKGEIRGRNTIISGILRKYILKILDNDIDYAPFTIIDLEATFNMQYVLKSSVAGTINIEGTIDRIDEKEGIVRVLDYKSGSVSTNSIIIDDLFDQESGKLNNSVTQVLTYCELFANKFPEKKIMPAILTLKELFKGKTDNSIRIKLPGQEGNKPGSTILDDYELVREHFFPRIENTIESIFDPEKNFDMTTDTRMCRNCDYILLCGRQ